MKDMYYQHLKGLVLVRPKIIIFLICLIVFMFNDISLNIIGG